MKLTRALATTVLIVGAFAFPSPPASASFHRLRIVEVFAGTPSNPDVQYVELQMGSAGQTFLAGQKVTFYDASGAKAGEAVFPENLGNGAAQSSVLLATEAAQSFFDIPSEVTMPPVLDGAGGAVDFANGIDHVSWASVPSDVHDEGEIYAFGSKLGGFAGGIADGAAIGRDLSRGNNATTLDAGDDTNNSADDFDYVVPSPRNNAGDLGHSPGGIVCITSPCGSAAELQVTDGGQVTVDVCIEGIAAPGSGNSTVIVATSNGRATAPDDFTAHSEVVEVSGECGSFTVATTGSGPAEPDEDFYVVQSGPSAGLVMGPPILAGRVTGETPAVAVTSITKPQHRDTYSASELTTFTGTVESHWWGVEVGLRRKMTNGSCRWLTQDSSGAQRFRSGNCSSPQYNLPASFSGEDLWTVFLQKPLGPSVGTTTKNYMVVSHAIGEGASDVVAIKGVNKNVLEVEINPEG